MRARFVNENIERTNERRSSTRHVVSTLTLTLVIVVVLIVVIAVVIVIIVPWCNRERESLNGVSRVLVYMCVCFKTEVFFFS